MQIHNLQEETISSNSSQVVRDFAGHAFAKKQQQTKKGRLADVINAYSVVHECCNNMIDDSIDMCLAPLSCNTGSQTDLQPDNAVLMYVDDASFRRQIHTYWILFTSQCNFRLWRLGALSKHDPQYLSLHLRQSRKCTLATEGHLFHCPLLK